MAGQVARRGEEGGLDSRELKRYNVKVAGLQETKWFGNDVYDVSGAAVLTSGRKTPSVGEN